MSANLEDSAVATGLEKVKPHPNPKKSSTKKCSKKMVTITLYAKQKNRHRCIEQTFGLCGIR